MRLRGGVGCGGSGKVGVSGLGGDGGGGGGGGLEGGVSAEGGEEVGDEGAVGGHFLRLLLGREEIASGEGRLGRDRW